jgi:hypothetical protein
LLPLFLSRQTTCVRTGRAFFCSFLLIFFSEGAEKLAGDFAGPCLGRSLPLMRKTTIASTLLLVQTVAASQRYEHTSQFRLLDGRPFSASLPVSAYSSGLATFVGLVNQVCRFTRVFIRKCVCARVCVCIK